MSNTSLPENKPKINGKYSTKDAIELVIDKLLESVKGNYSDSNWSGIENIQSILTENGISCELLDASYAGQGEADSSNLPTRKLYRFALKVRDRNGKNILIYLKINCSFIGKTGTMVDKDYKLNYSFF